MSNSLTVPESPDQLLVSCCLRMLPIPADGRCSMICLAAVVGVCVMTGAARGQTVDSRLQPDTSAQMSAWPMFGGSPSRNHVSTATGVSFDIKSGKTASEGRNLLWVADLGSHTYGNPVVSGGRVFVSTNNGHEYRPNHEGDRGVLLCFDQADGKFLWQLTREKLESGKANDWPEQGICSTPCIDGNRLYVVTNRCEVMCLDCAGFLDGTNDGSVQNEVDSAAEDADIIWSVDMMEDYQVYPHNMATCSPLVYGDLVYVLTSNGIDESHEKLPSPQAPSLLVLNRETGKKVWSSNLPSNDSRAPAPWNSILHGQWSSPTIGVVNGRAQVYLPGGDGVLYALDALSGELIWWFDLNPKDAQHEMAGRGNRNEIISTPVFYDDSVILATGQDPEHGDGEAYIYRIDAKGAGDVSSRISDGAGSWKANPDSGQIWGFGGRDTDGQITGERDALLFRRTISTAVVHDGLVYCPDLAGFLHCFDLASGQRYWQLDLFAAVWGSPVIVDGKLLLGDENGELSVVPAGRTLDESAIRRIRFRSSIYSAPTIVHGVMFVADRSRLYAFDIQPQDR